MEQFVIIALLVALCSATSPPFPNIIALDCNETLFETDVAMNLINEHRDEGFVLRPVRVKSAVQQEPVTQHGGFIYYMDLDVVETKCSVLSGKSWKECSIDKISFHETVYGHCKVITFISKPSRSQSLLNYNCTLGTVPSRAVAHICPDCPSPVTDITPEIKAQANQIIQQFNEDSNKTHHFKVDEIERVRTQYVFGQSYFFEFIIKETECLRTQADVNLDDCVFRADKDAVDKDYDDHRHQLCGHGPDRSNNKQGEEKTTVPGVDVAEEMQKDAGESGKGKEAPGNCEHGRCPLHRGHKHHRCRHEKRSKGSVEIYYLSAVGDCAPHPTIVHQPQKYEKPGKHGKFDNIEFPSEQSKLKTCPGEPMVELPQIVQDCLFK
ncbi:fetuin-B-like isoform X2 [Bufo bufo]|uniref:fetuin-B-like isoform X2 n=1 Tax=Bufo bufo TaxID=8384 RepID=UPI001ABEA35F|nr:fetuin-B-like isoform X2 [Bufo bufo]